MNESQVNLTERNAARTLVAVVFLFTVATIVLNTSSRELKAELARLEKRVEFTASNINKFMVYRDRPADMYFAMAVQALGGRVSFRQRNVVFATPPFDWTDEARRLAELTKAVLETTADETERFSLLYSEPGFDMWKTTNYFRATIRVDKSEAWDQIAWWIAFDMWPPPSGFVPGRRLPHGYGTTFNSSVDYRFYVLPELRLIGPEGARRFLVDEWREAATALQDFHPQKPSINLPGGNVPVPIDILLMLCAPTVLLAQLVFWFHWTKGRESESKVPFLFPKFGSPIDPLQIPFTRSLHDAAQRFVGGRSWYLRSYC